MREMMNRVVQLCISISFVVFAFVPRMVSAGSTASYESQLIDRWTDFEKIQKERTRAKAQDERELEEIRERRRERLAREEALRVQHVQKMKRYSMEEAERLEAENEKSTAVADRKRDQERLERIHSRNKLLELERRIGHIDQYLEYDIDMVREPESKTSWSDFKPSSAGEGRESF